MKTRTMLTHLLVAAGLLCPAAFPAAAQAPGGPGGGGLLTQDQRAKMRESMQASQAELTQLNGKLAAAQKAAVNAALAKDADDASVRAKIEAVAKIQTDIALLRFKAVKQIASTVTAEQKTQMEEAPGISYNVLLGSFGGGRGGGGGGRGGGAGGARKQ